MDERTAQLEKIAGRYKERGERLNSTADAALSEAIEAYREGQEKTVASANEQAEKTLNDAKSKAEAAIVAADRKAKDALLSAYTEFGVRK